jgi:hypothetical protein
MTRTRCLISDLDQSIRGYKLAPPRLISLDTIWQVYVRQLNLLLLTCSSRFVCMVVPASLEETNVRVDQTSGR